jgi:hypothetical protein
MTEPILQIPFSGRTLRSPFFHEEARAASNLTLIAAVSILSMVLASGVKLTRRLWRMRSYGPHP